MTTETQLHVPDLQKLAGLGSGLLSLLAHELRTPLATATSSAELIALRNDQWPPEKRAATLERVRASLGRMETIIENVSFIERIASGRMPREDQAVRLSSLVREALQVCAKGGCPDDVVVDVPRPEPMVSVDPRLFRHALVHMLSYLLPESAGACSISVSYEERPSVVIDVDVESPEYVRRGCDPDNQMRNLGLRYASVIAALHGARVSITGVGDTTLRGSIELMDTECSQTHRLR